MKKIFVYFSIIVISVFILGACSPKICPAYVKHKVEVPEKRG